MNLKSQPGEVCFPGGRIDETDKGPKEAAIRETVEELGIDKHLIFDVHPIDYFIQSYANRVIYPFVGIIDDKAQIDFNRAEVEEVFSVPLQYFFDVKPKVHQLSFEPVAKENDDFPYHLIPGGRNYPWKMMNIKEYFYEYENYVIWGLTAKIVRHFIEILQTSP